MNDITRFLTLNGFNKTATNSYSNSICSVVIEEDHYAVGGYSGNIMYSKDHNIYWLIGVLTYYGFINKSYIQ